MDSQSLDSCRHMNSRVSGRLEEPQPFVKWRFKKRKNFPAGRSEAESELIRGICSVPEWSRNRDRKAVPDRWIERAERVRVSEFSQCGDTPDAEVDLVVRLSLEIGSIEDFEDTTRPSRKSHEVAVARQGY
jgi:hypothetical protein